MILSFIDHFNLSLGSVGTMQARTGYGQSPKFLFAIQQQLGDSSNESVAADSILSSVGFATADLSMRSIAYKSSKTVGVVTQAVTADIFSLFSIHNQGAGLQTINGAWDVASFDSNGVTYRVNDSYTDSESPAAQVLALGGPAFSQVALGTFTLQEPSATAIVNTLSFSPDGVLMIVPSASGGIGIGAAVRRGVTLAATSSYFRNGGTVPVARSYTRYGECISTPGSGPATSSVKIGTLTNWRPDGFEVTSTTGGVNQFVYFAAFKMARGFDCRILTGSTATSATTVDLATVGQFRAKAGILASHNKAQSASGTSDVDAGLAIGMYTASTQRGYALYATNANENTGNIVVSSGSAYLNISNLSGIEGKMAITSLGTDLVQGTMSTGDPAQSALWSLAFGTVPVAKGGPLFF